MKKFFTLSAIGIAFALSLQAAPRSEADALQLAKSFYESLPSLRSVSEASFQAL